MEPHGSRYTSRCAVCGKPARIFLGSTSYCQDCYNRLSDYLAGVDSPTNDSYQILALDAKGHTVEFAVERAAFGTHSVWTATEQIADDDPRKGSGYVGRRVSIAVDARETSQEEALDALMVKAQRLTGHTSYRAVPAALGDRGGGAAQVAGRMLCANETGVVRIEADDDTGDTYVVVDGQRLSPQQFVDLLSCWEGFDLYWQVRGAADEPPAWL